MDIQIQLNVLPVKSSVTGSILSPNICLLIQAHQNPRDSIPLTSTIHELCRNQSMPANLYLKLRCDVAMVTRGVAVTDCSIYGIEQNRTENRSHR